MNLTPLKMLTAATAPVKTFTMHRITEFEGLRSILAWWVVLAHMLQACGFKPQNLPRLFSKVISAGYAVDIFIILSGFVIFLLLDVNRNKNYRQFIIERFFRIYPLFITAFFAAIALLPLRVAVLKNGQWNNLEYAATILQQAQNAYDYFIFHVVTHLTLLHGIFPDELLPSSSVAFLGPVWSLSLEWQFYLIAPFLILYMGRSWIASFSILGTIFIVRKLVSDLSFGYGAFLPLKMEFFLIGIFSYYAYKFTQLNPKLIQKAFPVLPIGLVLGILLLCFFPRNIAEMALPTEIWLIALCAAIAQSLQIKHSLFNAVARVLNHPILQHLGKVSYSTYVTHVFVFWVVMWVAMTIAPGIDRGSMLIVLSSIGTLGVLALSFALYYGIEKPFIQIGKRFSKKANSQSTAL
ncbi:MAG: acyltransferase [Lyngbya sp. HA4199-MV5]|jgi:peptidoglycan/LPS O-acetylase OafA/YrhL|nr:acyltransferase [Lyngbya sp. HA4199-MV5]